MSGPFPLIWRFLLAAALVFNPVAGAGMAMAATSASAGKPMAASKQQPPCHGAMGEHGTRSHIAVHEHSAKNADRHCPDHARGCGDTACQFGVCCSIGAFAIAGVMFTPVMHTSNRLIASQDRDGAPAPPPARMIRPPIA
jgi:hypothetical protein